MLTQFSISPLDTRHPSNWNKESQVSNPQIVKLWLISNPTQLCTIYTSKNNTLLSVSLLILEVGRRKDLVTFFKRFLNGTQRAAKFFLRTFNHCPSFYLSATQPTSWKKIGGDQISHVNTYTIGLPFLQVSCFLTSTKRAIRFSFSPPIILSHKMDSIPCQKNQVT